MAELAKLPIAHLVNSDPVDLKCNNLIELLEQGAGDGERALTYLDTKNKEDPKSYEDVLDGARIVANYLKNRGLKKGDKVVILLATSERFSNAFFGTIMAGGIPVPASPPMTFGDIEKYLTNLSHIVANCEARFMITFNRIMKVIGNVLSKNNNISHLILARDITDEGPRVPGFPTVDDDDPAFIQYTSGTTNQPKGVVLSHRALLSNACGITNGVQAGPHTVGVSWLPMFHDMGLIGVLLAGLYSRSRLILMKPEAFIMNPVSWLRNITRYGGTVAVAPNFAYHLCAQRISDVDLATIDLSTLSVAMNGAEPIDLRTLEAFEKRFEPLGFGDNVHFPVYGMAENCLAVTFPAFGRRYEVEHVNRMRLESDGKAVGTGAQDPTAYKAVSVGFPVTGQQVAISDPQGGFAREYRVGEVLVKSPSLMSGYYHNPKATAAVLTDGWLHTGDLGYVGNGRLFITGRAKEMIIKRGRNYYPYDIERAASDVPGVRKGCLAAFAIPNPERGTEDLVLVVETREASERKKQDIENRIGSEVLSAIGVKPDKIVLVPPRSIPKTSSGKLQRLLCRRRYLDNELVKGYSERWLTPVKTLVGSFIGNQRFRFRARSS